MRTLSTKEPAIEDIFNDPIIEMLMDRDGVQRDPLLALLRQVAESDREQAISRLANFPS